MKVADIMQTEVESVSTDATVREISHLIFGRNINGVPVVDGKKIVGFITEKDILAAFFPTMEDIIEDPIRSQDFSEIENRAEEILRLPAKKVMSRNITTVTSDIPIMKAEALMLSHKVGRLPVVDADKKLIGVVSKGDIFRAAVGQKMPIGREERFYDWLARHYDILMDWDKRLKAEIPELTQLFTKNKTNHILDVGFSTGEHAIALAKNGFEVTGIDTSSFIAKIAEKKKSALPEKIKQKINFSSGEYKNILSELGNDFDGVIFMGNALSHVMRTNKNILKDINKHLSPKNATLVFQIVNVNKFIEKDKGLERFAVGSAPIGFQRNHAFVGFYSKGEGNIATYTQAIFDTDGHKWIFSGMRSTPVLTFTKAGIKKMLGDIGFSDIKFYGGDLYRKMFAEEYLEKESDMLNVVARR